jgi:Domain of unknown function (DUF4383)
MSSLQSPPMDAPSPARLYATAVGAALVVFGIVGFFYSASFGSPGEVDDVFGVFAVNGWDNVLHIVTGAIGLIAADYASRRYSLWMGAFYLALAFWGFVLGSGGSVLGFLPVDTGDNLLHLAIGALGVLAARGTPVAKPKREPATT